VYARNGMDGNYVVCGDRRDGLAAYVRGDRLVRGILSPAAGVAGLQGNSPDESSRWLCSRWFRVGGSLRTHDKVRKFAGLCARAAGHKALLLILDSTHDVRVRADNPGNHPAVPPGFRERCSSF